MALDPLFEARSHCGSRRDRGWHGACHAAALIEGSGGKAGDGGSSGARVPEDYFMPVIFSTAAWEFFNASSGVSVPATAFDSSMPKAFSISGHFGWRGRGVDA